MLKGVKSRLDRVTETRARRMNLVFSTAAGLIYLYVFLNLQRLEPQLLTATVLIAAVLDFSTVYFVHSGALAGTLTRIFSESMAELYVRLHTLPGIIGYFFLAGFLASLHFKPAYWAFKVFLASWVLMYVSGLYAYARLS